MALARTKPHKLVGRYQLAHELATSYLGPLWAARVDGSDVAGQLAMLRLVSLARLDADTRVRLLEAAWQAMEVRDAHVCSVTDVVASDGELSIVSDYTEGVPLRTLQGLSSLRRKPLAVGVALRIIADLLVGVEALHRATVELGDEAVPLYGGLSPDSILIGTDGRTTVLDVAVGSVASTVESLGGNPERVAYAAPEQLSEPPHADARTDVFTIGVLAWELLSGRRLFVGADKAIVQKVLAAKIPRIDELRRKGDPEIASELSAIVTRALDRDPTRRFQSATELSHAIDATGIVASDPSEVTAYLALVAEGALSRTRDALKDPATTAGPGGSLSKIPPGRARVGGSIAPDKPGPKPKLSTVPPLRKPVATTPARSHQPTMIGIPPPARLETEAAARAVAALAQQGSAPPPALPEIEPTPPESVLAAKPEAAESEPTHRGPPKPTHGAEPIGSAPTTVAPEPEPRAYDRFESIPPVPHTFGETPPPPAPLPDDSIDEPTGQYTAHDLLKQVEELARRSDRADRPPTDFPEPRTDPRDDDLVGRPTGRFSSEPRAPAFGRIEEDAWLDDPVPIDAARAMSPTEPELPATVIPAREPLAETFPDSLVSPIESRAPQPEPSLPKVPEKRSFSKRPPSSGGGGFIPSQIPPPLMHDPRARRSPTRVKSSNKFRQGLALGILGSLGLMVVSAMLGMVALRGRGVPAVTSASLAVPSAMAAAAIAAPPAAEPAASVAEPAPSTTVAPPPSAPPQGASVPAGEPPPRPAMVAAAPKAPIAARTQRASHGGSAPRAGGKKKHARFVPDDI